MNSPSREEIDAKFETVDARIDGRIAVIQASLDGVKQVIEQLSARLAELSQRVDALSQRVDALSQRVDDIAARIDSIKSTIVLTALSSVIAIVLGVAGFTSAISSNLLAAIKQGGDMSAERAAVRRQVEETDALLRRLEATLPTNPPTQQRGQQQQK